MSYQILALDLDGTLTNSRKEISKPTLDALIEIQQQGKKVVLASGRPTKGVFPLAKLLHLDRYGSYILSFNGGRITDCRSNTVIYNKTLPADITEPLFHVARKYSEYGIDILGYTSDTIISGIYPNDYTELESKINNMPIVQAGDFSSYVNALEEAPNKFLIVGKPEIISKVKAEAIDRFRSYLYIYLSEPFFLEIMPPGIDKARSLLKLLTSNGLSADEMVCCGDGYNDLSMIETAGLGVAMANAQPTVLERADYITKSNDDDGVLHVIDKFMRI